MNVVAAILCQCWPFALPGLLLGISARREWERGRYANARDRFHIAKLLAIVAFVTTVLAVLFLVINLLFDSAPSDGYRPVPPAY